jgi:hypothetical protein
MDVRGEPAFTTPSGIPLPSVPRYDVRGRPDILLAANRQRGVAPDFRTGRTRWPQPDDVQLGVRRGWGGTPFPSHTPKCSHPSSTPCANGAVAR